MIKSRSNGTDVSEKRVRRYAARHFGVRPTAVSLTPLTPDASTRKYYRVGSEKDPAATFIISLYPAPFNPQDNSFLDVTRLFQRAGLPVPQIVAVAGTEGIILQEDLGDRSLAIWIEEAEGSGDRAGIDRMIERAIELIARIQAASTLARETGSVAGRLAFDADKFSWELNYFYDHFFGSLRRETREDEALIRRELGEIAAQLAARPRVLVHRDYHAMNLMVDARGELRIIDHQDARMGPASYDLVPLLVERRAVPADQSWVEAQLERFLQACDEARVPHLDPAEFRDEFNLMTVQRQLKATGTFSYQTAVVGRSEYYEKYIGPAVATVLRAMRASQRREYPALRAALEQT